MDSSESLDDITLKECMENCLNIACTFELLRLRGSVTPFLSMFGPRSMDGWETKTFAMSLF